MQRRQSGRRPPRHPLDWQNPGFLRRGEARRGIAPRLRHLPRLPPLLQFVRFLSAPVRSGRRRADRRTRRRRSKRFQARRRRLHALRHVLHDEMPLCAAARVQSRFSASDAALPRRRGEKGRGDIRRSRAGEDRPQRSLAAYVAPLANWATDCAHRPRARCSKTVAGSIASACLPPYHSKTLPPSREKAVAAVVNRGRARPSARKAVIYATCFANYNEPAIGSRPRRGAGAERRRDRSRLSRIAAACRSWSRAPSPRWPTRREASRPAMQPWIDKGYDVVALIRRCAPDAEVRWPLILPENEDVEAPVQGDAMTSANMSSPSRQGGAGAGPRARSNRRRRAAPRLSRPRAEYGGQGARASAAHPRRRCSR